MYISDMHTSTNIQPARHVRRHNNIRPDLKIDVGGTPSSPTQPDNIFSDGAGEYRDPLADTTTHEIHTNLLTRPF